MNGVLVWKVYREQRWVWLAMAVLAVGAVVLRLTLLRSELEREALGRLFCLFAYIYGLVVGAVLLAGEQEAGTSTFLESLPVKRLAVWGAKCGAGLLLVLAQVVFLWFLLLVEIVRDSRWGMMLLVVLVGVSMLGFAWGLFFSGRTKTAIGAIFAAMLGQVVLSPLMIAIGNEILDLLHAPPGSRIDPVSQALIFCCLPVVVGLICGSGMSEAQHDHRTPVPRTGSPSNSHQSRSRFEWQGWDGLAEWPEPEIPEEDSWLAPPRRARQPAWRRPTQEPAGGSERSEESLPSHPGEKPALTPSLETLSTAAGTLTPAWRLQLAALLWLELRQGGRLFLWLAGAGLIAGVLPLWVLGWPVLTLVLGAIAGVSVFAGEQLQATGRFLAEQRLPLGRIWAVKVGARLALALGVVQLMLLPAAACLAFREAWELGGSVEAPTQIHLLAPYVQLGPYLTLGLLHGFSVGCLCGLLFRKPVIAGAIAVAAGLLLVLLWIPSLLVGGLHGWQYWGLPVLLLLTVRLLVWPWATDRLSSRSSVLRLTSEAVKKTPPQPLPYEERGLKRRLLAPLSLQGRGWGGVFFTSSQFDFCPLRSS